MSAEKYLNRIQKIIGKIQKTQLHEIRKAGKIMAEAIASGHRVYLFGSGHSVIPVMDVFPRYGSFVGFYPLYDPRLMWHNVIGPGGARELLWIERKEGYARIFLQSYSLLPGDVVVIFSHGGRNAAPIEVALEARSRGLKVITVSSHQNLKISRPAHSSGQFLSDVADVAIDNCTPPEDALVEVGKPEKIAAGSTVAAVSVAMALVAEAGTILAKEGKLPPTFVSPNVKGVAPDHNDCVYQAFTEFFYGRPAPKNIPEAGASAFFEAGVKKSSDKKKKK
ncbi:MAG: sugar isomerase domain-containing protein [Candidatus Saccharicenans sp.]|uniref:sugar isomerase domain-containing protein n=1 Tax=Candidatus Saccharicenans sp. TaxID=2819258 RepID=UPI00404A7E84